MRLILLVVPVLIAGCVTPHPGIPVAPPATFSQPATIPSATQPESTAPGVAVRLGDRDILYLAGVTAHLPRHSVECMIVPQPLAQSPGVGELVDDVVVSHALAAMTGGAPEMTCRMISRDNGRQVTIAVESRSRLPQLSLTAVLPRGIYPARYRPSEGFHATQAAIGPATRLLFDSLYDSRAGTYATYSGNVSVESSSDGYLLRAWTDATINKRVVLLRLGLQVPDNGKPGSLSPPISVERLAPPVSLKEARRLAGEWAVAPSAEMTGTAWLTEALNRLPVERVELLRRTYPLQPVRRVDRFGDTTMWNLAIARPPEQWNVLVLSNPSAIAKTQPIGLKRLGISPPAKGRLAVYDFWHQQLVAVTDDVFEIDMPAGDCRVLCVRDVRPNEPSVLSTSPHITQGLADLTDVSYDPQSMTLSGRSNLFPDEAHELRILLPIDQKSLEIASVDANMASSLVRSDGPLRMITLESNAEQTVSWSIGFRRASLPLLPPPPPARMSTRQNTRGVLLSWDAANLRPARYRIYRDGKALATVAGSENQYQDSDIVYDASYAYTIRSVDWAGQESPPLPEGVHRTPVPANAYLTQLVPLFIEGPAPSANRNVGGSPLRMAGRRYHRGLGTLPGNRMDYLLGKGYDRFSGEVGIDDATTAKGRARFEILADGHLLFSSEPLAVGDKPQRFNVPVNGCRRLTLLVVKVDDTDGQVHANWGDTYLRASITPGR
ncbi:MAG: NPCBM/NEW2 domain-containing protein [Phycisphaerae bacterium]